MYKIAFVLLLIGVQAQAQQPDKEKEKAVDHVVIVLDDSGSMDQTLKSNSSLSRMDAAKTALVTVLSQIKTNSKVGLILLNGSPTNGYWSIPLQTINKQQAVATINELAAGGGTPLGERMKDGCDALLECRKKDHYGTYRLLIVTDGEANDAGLVDQYTPDIMSRGLTVDVIGVDMRQNHSLAEKVHNYRRADDPASLEQAIKAVFAETDPNDTTSREDYELTSAIPGDMAKEALVALGNTGNQPIGAQPELQVNEDGTIQIDASGNPIAATSGLGYWWFLICFGVIVVVFFIVAACSS